MATLRRLFLVVALALAAGPARAAEATVLKAARLIDGRGGAALSPAMVLVEDDRIRAVGSQLAVPPGARVLDLGDATLLPGLIDLHTHLTGREDVHWEEALIKSTPPDDALWGAHFARLTLLAGFTTCRDMGPNWPYVEVPLVKNLADGPEEIVKGVRTNFKNGADFIKILATGAVLSRGIPPGVQQYSDEEIRAAVTEARRWGRTVAAHAHATDGIKAAIRAGVRTVDHGSMLDDEAVAMLKDASTYYVPTLYIMEVVPNNPRVPAPERERALTMRERRVASFKLALRARTPRRSRSGCGSGRRR